jgi:hypothetical protein
MACFWPTGGAIALTGQSDHHSPIKYCGNVSRNRCDQNPQRLLHEHDLKFLRITDFEMIDHGRPVIEWKGDCRRTTTESKKMGQ